MTEMTRAVRKAQVARAEEAVRQHYTGTRTPDLLSIACAAAPDMPLTEGWLTALLSRLDQARPELRHVDRTAAEWSAIFPRYPLDADGFAAALPAEDITGIRATLATFGIAVAEVLSAEECAATVAAMFAEINTLTKPTRPTILPDAPHTWHSKNWPSSSKFLLRRPALHPVAFANRANPRLYRLFAGLWDEERLCVTVDNWGLARGTRGMPFPQPDGTVSIEDRPKWHQEIAPHWDYNPWLFVDEEAGGRQPGWQGLLALNDQTVEGGCHRTLPGGAPFLKQWCTERVCPESLGQKRRSHRPGAEDPIRQYMQDIPLRAGHIVLWSWGQLHASVPNHGASMRMHQYIRLFPTAGVDPFYTSHDRYAAPRILAEHPGVLDGMALSPLAGRLLGAAPW